MLGTPCARAAAISRRSAPTKRLVPQISACGRSVAITPAAAVASPIDAGRDARPYSANSGAVTPDASTIARDPASAATGARLRAPPASVAQNRRGLMFVLSD